MTRNMKRLMKQIMKVLADNLHHSSDQSYNLDPFLGFSLMQEYFFYSANPVLFNTFMKMNLKFRHWDSIFCSNFIESSLYRSARSDNPWPHHTTIFMGTVTKTVISFHFVLDNLKHNKKYQFQDSWGRY